MTARRPTNRPLFTVLGALAGFILVGAAATCFVYSAGDPRHRAHWLRVTIAAVIGAGVGAYLGETRRQFILNCTAPLALPLTAIRRALYHNRDLLHFALRLSMAGLVIAAWALWVVGPDWRLHRIVDRLQSSDQNVSQSAVWELKGWRDGGISGLVRERNEMLARLLEDERAEVRAAGVEAFAECEPEMDASRVTPALLKICRDANPGPRALAAYTLGQIGADAVPTIPVLVELLRDSDPRVRGTAALALEGFGMAAEEAVPELAKMVSDVDEWPRRSAISALGSIHSNPSVSVPALLPVFASSDLEDCVLASEALAEFGKQAADAVPTLETESKCGVYLRERIAWYAISEIAPERYADLAGAAAKSDVESSVEEPSIDEPMDEDK